jgi:hypothetical protein
MPCQLTPTLRSTCGLSETFRTCNSPEILYVRAPGKMKLDLRRKFVHLDFDNTYLMSAQMSDHNAILNLLCVATVSTGMITVPRTSL